MSKRLFSSVYGKIFVDVQQRLEMNFYYVIFAFIVLNMSVMSSLLICFSSYISLLGFFGLFYKFRERRIKISHYECKFACFCFNSVHFWFLPFEFISVNAHKFIFIFYWWIESFVTTKWTSLSLFVYFVWYNTTIPIFFWLVLACDIICILLCSTFLYLTFSVHLFKQHKVGCCFLIQSDKLLAFLNYQVEQYLFVKWNIWSIYI